MGSAKIEKVKYSVERQAKGSRRFDIYLIVFAVFFVITFIATQIMLGMYEV